MCAIVDYFMASSLKGKEIGISSPHRTASHQKWNYRNQRKFCNRIMLDKLYESQTSLFWKGHASSILHTIYILILHLMFWGPGKACESLFTNQYIKGHKFLHIEITDWLQLSMRWSIYKEWIMKNQKSQLKSSTK